MNRSIALTPGCSSGSSSANMMMHELLLEEEGTWLVIIQGLTAE